ncbi:hypothetical protein BDW66DRAFT_118013 [Aspergillus desertorum]
MTGYLALRKFRIRSMASLAASLPYTRSSPLTTLFATLVQSTKRHKTNVLHRLLVTCLLPSQDLASHRTSLIRRLCCFGADRVIIWKSGPSLERAFASANRSISVVARAITKKLLMIAKVCNVLIDIDDATRSESLPFMLRNPPTASSIDS